MLWSIGAALVAGALGCLVGLAGSDSATDIYLAGLAVAAGSALLLGRLAASRARMLFEAERATADLRRLCSRLAAAESERDHAGLEVELGRKLESVEAYASAVVAAEAYEQALVLDTEIAQAAALLGDGKERGR
jgi:hypothetical protein